MKANQHGVLICRVCNQNKERRSQVYRGARGDYVLGRAIHASGGRSLGAIPYLLLIKLVNIVCSFSGSSTPIFFPASMHLRK